MTDVFVVDPRVGDGDDETLAIGSFGHDDVIVERPDEWGGMLITFDGAGAAHVHLVGASDYALQRIDILGIDLVIVIGIEQDCLHALFRTGHADNQVNTQKQKK